MSDQSVIERMAEWQVNPLPYIEDIWGLVPQPLLPDYAHMEFTAEAHEFRKDMFYPFVKGVHCTWQQWLIFRAIHFALLGIGKKRISIESGHGTGKSMTLALITLWFLTVFKDAQIPVTAPTAMLMKDVLWKEIKKWQKKMPNNIADSYVMTDGYLRHKASPETWFARARTASKDQPEAMAGIHGENVLMIVDEASGVFDEVFEVMEGALTDSEGNTLVILASNHTRNEGYYHETHGKNAHMWQTISLNSLESPIVSMEFVNNIIDTYGRNSDQYRVRVEGKSPHAEQSDDKGWKPLLRDEDITWTRDRTEFSGQAILGVDPSGEGKDSTDWVGRDQFVMRKMGEEKISTPKSIAAKTIEIAQRMGIPKEEAYRIIVDIFGVGADTVVELVKAGWIVTGINVGNKATQDGYINLRAQMSWSFRRWIKNGGEVLKSKSMKQLTVVKYQRTEGTGNPIKIMSKKEMKKNGIESPNTYDAGMLTFVPHEIVDLEAEEEWGEDYDGDENQYSEYGA